MLRAQMHFFHKIDSFDLTKDLRFYACSGQIFMLIDRFLDRMLSLICPQLIFCNGTKPRRQLTAAIKPGYTPDCLIERLLC